MSTYVDHIVEQLERVAPVTAKKMFGAVGLYADGPIFGIVDNDVLYFKVDDENRQQYLDASMPAFMPNGSTPMGYYQVPIEVIEDRSMLTVWMHGALEAARRAGERKAGRKTRR